MLGSLAEWISALGAIGALAAAIWAAKTSVKLFAIETGRDELAAAKDERRQASGIAAWCVGRNDGPGKRGILIRNSSDDPVHDVTIESTYAPKKDLEPEPQAPLTLAILPPGDYIAEEHPKFHWDFPEYREAADDQLQPIMKNPQWMVTAIRFTDAHGNTWERQGGALTKIDDARRSQ